MQDRRGPKVHKAMLAHRAQHPAFGSFAQTAMRRPAAGDHRHGIADVKDECSSLHLHLAGVLPFTVRAVSISFAVVLMVVPPARALASADPILLERPPKSSSLI